jgi:hypothetical protein
MDEKTERVFMVALAVLGVAHEMYTRERVVKTVTGGSPVRAAQYHAAAKGYRKCAEWFGRQALRAESSYYAEISG